VGDEEPVAAMAVAAVLADAVREALGPGSSPLPPDGPLGLRTPDVAVAGSAVLVGVGGIGVYTATALAARGCSLCLVDFDRVEESNLNRQGLFTAADASARDCKSLAAREILTHLFPDARVSADVRRVGGEYCDALARLPVQPDALLSAVDNASTRLVLQGLGRDRGLPVIQAGTAMFAADCFTQGARGPLLDEQMHGALTQAAARETSADRRGGCAGDPSYVVPGMMAGALLAHRFVQVCAGQEDVPPIHWRSGGLPAEPRSLVDDLHSHELTLQ
jgi:hypothetical protein